MKKPKRWSDLFAEMSIDQLQAAIDEAAAAERHAAGHRERAEHRKRRHAAEVELRLRTEGTLPMPDLFRAVALTLLMTVAILAFAGYLASTVDGDTALFGLLGLPFGALAARTLGRLGVRGVWASAVVVSATGVIALLAQTSQQSALLIAVSTAAGLWYETLLVPFVIGMAIIVRRRRRRSDVS